MPEKYHFCYVKKKQSMWHLIIVDSKDSKTIYSVRRRHYVCFDFRNINWEYILVVALFAPIYELLFFSNLRFTAVPRLIEAIIQVSF